MRHGHLPLQPPAARAWEPKGALGFRVQGSGFRVWGFEVIRLIEFIEFIGLIGFIGF